MGDKSAFETVVILVAEDDEFAFRFITRILESLGVADVLSAGNGVDANIRKGRIHKIDGFLIKPPSADTLSLHLKEVLGL